MPTTKHDSKIGTGSQETTSLVPSTMMLIRLCPWGLTKVRLSVGLLLVDEPSVISSISKLLSREPQTMRQLYCCIANSFVQLSTRPNLQHCKSLCEEMPNIWPCSEAVVLSREMPFGFLDSGWMTEASGYVSPSMIGGAILSMYENTNPQLSALAKTMTLRWLTTLRATVP